MSTIKITPEQMAIIDKPCQSPVYFGSKDGLVKTYPKDELNPSSKSIRVEEV